MTRQPVNRIGRWLIFPDGRYRKMTKLEMAKFAIGRFRSVKLDS